jgi:putative ABC transport system substrate-binding protein
LRGSVALASLGLLSGCAALPIGPQRPARLPRVGYLDSGASQDRADGFRLGLADHGYVEGRNIIVEWRNPEGQLDRLPGLAAELVGLPVDVLVASGDTPTRLLKDATGTIPIVMVVSASPVEQGLVASLARPGGNITGLTTLARELDQKRLQLFKETVPGLARVGVLWNPEVDDRERAFQVAEEAARALGLEVRSLEARDHGALEAAFERAAAERVDGLFLIDNSVLTANWPRIVEFARRHRLPTSSVLRSMVAAGGLFSYGANIPSLNRRAAGYVDRILKGADPAEMPIERPTAFDLVLNLKTARELGLTIPESVLQQATEVIQ